MVKQLTTRRHMYLLAKGLCMRVIYIKGSQARKLGNSYNKTQDIIIYIVRLEFIMRNMFPSQVIQSLLKQVLMYLSTNYALVLS